MVVFLVSNEIKIKSHNGIYTASFKQGGMDELNKNVNNEAIYIIDKNIAELYKGQLENILKNGRVLIIQATEENKTLEKLPKYIDELVGLSVRREQQLVAIGGGIIQDITCFLATTLMRGLPWIFYPTTLLAQADSCIGSKSSINSGDVKNILGTFTPPDHVVIDIDFLSTLSDKDIFSGIGEMIKVHTIDSPESFNSIADAYDEIITNKSVMQDYIRASLLIKKIIIELDEFDKGPRNVMNYGHSFGHAIESATNFGIPHGIAVTIGMDMANYVSASLGITMVDHFKRMHSVMKKNFQLFRDTKIDADQLISALQKDKKNTSTQLRLILPNMEGRITIGLYDNSEDFKNIVRKYLTTVYGEL